MERRDRIDIDPRHKIEHCNESREGQVKVRRRTGEADIPETVARDSRGARGRRRGWLDGKGLLMGLRSISLFDLRLSMEGRRGEMAGLEWVSGRAAITQTIFNYQFEMQQSKHLCRRGR
jgi:hypothetical protein